MDDLFRPEPAGQPGDPQGGQPQQQAVPPQQQAPGGAPEYWGAPPQPGQQGGPQAGPAAGAAPETQHLPPYPAGEPSIGGGLPMQQQGLQGGQGGYGAPQAYPAAPPQQPGYGAQPSYGGQQGFGGAQGAVPPPAAPQTFGGQTFGGQQGFGSQQTFGGHEPGAQTYGGQQTGGYQPAGAAPAGGGKRPSQKLVIGGVVAGCAAAGILVAVLMSGGGEDKTPGTPVAKPVTSNSAGAGPAAVTPEMQAQAKAMSDLLGKASSSRQAVIGAVSSVQKCDKLPDAQTSLTAAAAQRDQLVSDLAALKVDKLPSGPQLVEQLQKAWTASSTADKEYAAWAGDSIAACDPAKQAENQHAKNGNAASGTATTAKTQASDLWNAIATQTSLPTREKGDL